MGENGYVPRPLTTTTQPISEATMKNVQDATDTDTNSKATKDSASPVTGRELLKQFGHRLKQFFRYFFFGVSSYAYMVISVFLIYSVMVNNWWLIPVEVSGLILTVLLCVYFLDLTIEEFNKIRGK